MQVKSIIKQVCSNFIVLQTDLGSSAHVEAQPPAPA